MKAVSDLQSLKEAITTLLTLPDGADKEVIEQYHQGRDAILGALKDPNAVVQAISLVLQDERTYKDSSLLNRVQLFADIYRFTGQSAALTEHIFKLLGKQQKKHQQIATKVTPQPLVLQQSEPTIADVARGLYHCPDVPTVVDQTTVDKFRTSLFEHEPTSVLLGLIERGGISIAAAVKIPVIKIFESAVQGGFNISLDSTRLLLQQKADLISELKLKDKTMVGETVKKIQRLQALVRDPLHIGQLVVARFDSAKSIANNELTAFQKTMSATGMAADIAARIHDHASTVQIRNEQAWAMALGRRNDGLLPQVFKNPGVNSDGSDNETQSLTAKKRINLTTLFDDMDTVACTEC